MGEGKGLVLRLTVQTAPGRRWTFEEPLPCGAPTPEALRRLWEAERALNDLTSLRVHIGVEAAEADGRGGRRGGRRGGGRWRLRSTSWMP